MLVMNVVMVMTSYYLAYFIIFKGVIPGREWLEIKASISWALRLYRGMWRYTSRVDLFNFVSQFREGDLQITQSCY